MKTATTNGDHATNGSASGVYSGHDPVTEFHATTRVLLETQQAQSRTLERFLETQERVLLYATQGVPPAAAVMAPPPPVQPVAAPPTPAAAPALLPAARLRLAPAAVSPAAVRPPVPIPASLPATSSRLEVAPAVGRNPGGPPPVAAPNGLAKAGPEENGVARPAPAPAAEGLPSTEQFRKDLLEVVSTRTGYPTDALDETLHLEAGMGIDSLKRIEIFSSLKAYHRHFLVEGLEVQELLADVAKLKNLRDIIDYYDRRRRAYLAGPQTNGTGEPAADSPNGSVKRYEVVAVPAPAEANGSKKNSLTATSSS
jgi:hypothetical protein